VKELDYNNPGSLGGGKNSSQRVNRRLRGNCGLDLFTKKKKEGGDERRHWGTKGRWTPVSVSAGGHSSSLWNLGVDYAQEAGAALGGRFVRHGGAVPQIRVKGAS